MSRKKDEKTYEIPLARALREELNHLKHKIPPEDGTPSSSPESDGQSDEKLNDVFTSFHQENLSALCFSGGGIRSATFALGIVESLAKHGLLGKFDYLSTVSGGGYLGSWLSAWIRREQVSAFERTFSNNGESSDGESDNTELFDGALFGKYKNIQDLGVNAVQNKLNNQTISNSTCPNPEPNQLQYLREYSNYMSPRVGLLSADTWTLVGIYTRNLFLNWTIFIPLISAILLIPRLFFAFTDLREINQPVAKLVLPIALLGGILAVRFAVDKLPSKNTDTSKETKYNTDGWVLGLGILPLLISAFSATTAWAWYKFNEPTNFVIFTVSIFLLGYLLFDVFKRPRVKLDWKAIIAALVSSAIGGFLMWLVVYNLFEDLFFDFKQNPNNLSLYVCLAVPIYLLIFLIESTIFVGLSSMFVTDADREWLARFGAWILIGCGAWLVLNSLVLFGPIGFGMLIAKIEKVNINLPFSTPEFLKDSIIPLIAAISGLISLAGGFSGKSAVRKEPAPSKFAVFLSIAPQIAAVVFLGFLLVGLAYLSSWLLHSVKIYFSPTLTGDPKILYLFVCFLGLAVIGIVMACFINVNKFSFHGAYRDRLIRAYLGASHVNRKGNKFTGFDDTDNFQLHRLKGQKPFHIINATLNLVDGKNLAWQNRKAATFTMTPLHCGSWLLGYRHTNEYSRNQHLDKCKALQYCNKFKEPCHLLDKDGKACTDEFGKRLYGVEYCKLPGKALRLGTAMAISGAAANPNMGYYSSPVVTFLLSLFNIRLGWWLGNTGKIGDRKDWWGRGNKFYTKTSPSIAVLPLINETFGRTDENKRYLNITDGGHFENLALYEMVLRRCRFILLSDAAADGNFTFSEISNAIEKCKVDLGVDIRFDDGIDIYARYSAEDHEHDRQRFAVAEIIYPEKNEDGSHRKGYLLYIRPTIYGDEPTDIQHYANLNRTFPHQSTGDQLYDEQQFEAYRALGFFIMEKILEESLPILEEQK